MEKIEHESIEVEMRQWKMDAQGKVDISLIIYQ